MNMKWNIAGLLLAGGTISVLIATDDYLEGRMAKFDSINRNFLAAAENATSHGDCSLKTLEGTTIAFAGKSPSGFFQSEGNIRLHVASFIPEVDSTNLTASGVTYTATGTDIETGEASPRLYYPLPPASPCLKQFKLALE